MTDFSYLIYYLKVFWSQDKGNCFQSTNKNQRRRSFIHSLTQKLRISDIIGISGAEGYRHRPFIRSFISIANNMTTTTTMSAHSLLDTLSAYYNNTTTNNQQQYILLSSAIGAIGVLGGLALYRNGVLKAKLGLPETVDATVNNADILGTALSHNSLY